MAPAKVRERKRKAIEERIRVRKAFELLRQAKPESWGQEVFGSWRA